MNDYFFIRANNTMTDSNRAASIRILPIGLPFIYLLIDAIVYMYVIRSPHNFLDISLRGTLQSHGGV